MLQLWDAGGWEEGGGWYVKDVPVKSAGTYGVLKNLNVRLEGCVPRAVKVSSPLSHRVALIFAFTDWHCFVCEAVVLR